MTQVDDDMLGRATARHDCSSTAIPGVSCGRAVIVFRELTGSEVDDLKACQLTFNGVPFYLL